MLKYILILLLACGCSDGFADAGLIGLEATHEAVGASCSYVSQDSDTNTANYKNVFRTANSIHRIAYKFTASSSYSVCRAGFVYYLRYGTTGSFHAEIWTDSSGPSAQTGGSSDSINFSDITENPGGSVEETVDWSSDYPSLTNAVSYWVVWIPDQSTTNGDYVRMRYTDGGSSSDDVMSWTSGGGWVAVGSNSAGSYNVYN